MAISKFLRHLDFETRNSSVNPSLDSASAWTSAMRSYKVDNFDQTSSIFATVLRRDGCTATSACMDHHLSGWLEAGIWELTSCNPGNKKLYARPMAYIILYRHYNINRSGSNIPIWNEGRCTCFVFILVELQLINGISHLVHPLQSSFHHVWKLDSCLSSMPMRNAFMSFRCKLNTRKVEYVWWLVHACCTLGTITF